MRPRLVLAVPLLVLMACTGTSSEGAASASPPAKTSASGTSTPTSSSPRSAGRGRQVAGRGAYANWPTYHGNRLRTGRAATMPPARGAPTVARRYHLDGAVYASPIVIAGRTVVATENDSIYAIENGSIIWRRHLGTPATDAQLPCGNIVPLGITGTPVYHHGIVYVAAELSHSPPRHRLFALRLSTGRILWQHTLDLPGVEQRAMQQRGALTFAGGRVWVPFGGLWGDCGNYRGRVVGVRLDGSGGAIKYTVPTQREAGIWATPGPLFDGRNLFVAVGNGASTISNPQPYDKSDAILKIGLHAHLRQFFAPSTWRDDNEHDADLGSQGPAIVGKWVFADGKRGRAYVLRRNRLGGIGGAVSSRDLCTSFGGTAVVGSRVFVPCTDGIRAVRIGRAGNMHLLWHAGPSGSPVVGGGRVWTVDPGSGVLSALDPTNGSVLNSVGVGAVTHFASPAVYGARMFIPTLDGLTVVTTS